MIQKRYFQTVCLLSLFLFFMCIRTPEVFIYGRFFAEEGNIFFYHAWTLPPLEALFKSFGGYLNLATNVVILIARWCIPLEYAPYFTTIVGLLFQLLPLFFLLTAKDEWLSPFTVRLFLTLLLLLVPETLETSLQSLHIQFQLTLSCAIILMLEPNYSYQRWLKIFTLMLAGLSGLMNIVLIPLYILHCWIYKNKLRVKETITLSISCLIQYLFFYEKLPSRFHSFIPSDFFNIFFIHELYIPFLGINHYTRIYINYLHNHMHNIHVYIYPLSITILFIIGIFGLFYKKEKTRQGLFLFLSALFIFTISIIGSIGERELFLIPFNNQRYLFISQSLLCILLVYITYNLSFIGKNIGKIIIYWLIFIGTIHFFATSISIVNNPNNYLPWKQQVKLWKNNSNYTFQIWPKGWEHMTLPISKK